MQKKINLRPLLIGLMLLGITSCEVILDQDARNAFVDGKLPEYLFRLVNQQHDQQKDRIVKRVIEDQNKNVIRVGIIDSGTQIYHPDLIDQMDFKLDDKNNIIGAGRDIFGFDNFPDPTYVRFEAFAFAADDIIDGKILAGKSAPLELLKFYDKKFTDTFLNKIKNSKELEGTIFTRLSPESFNLFSALSLLKTDDQEMIKGWIKNQKKDEENSKEEGTQLIDLSTSLKDPYEIQTNGLNVYRFLYEKLLPQHKWDFKTMSPAIYLNGSNLKGLSVFNEILTKSYEELIKSTDLEKRLLQVVEFLDQRSFFSKGLTDAQKKDQAVQELENDYRFKSEGYMVEAKIRHAIGMIRAKITEEIFIRDFANKGKFPTQKIQYTPNDVKNFLKNYLALAMRVNKYGLDNKDLIDSNMYAEYKSTFESTKGHINQIENLLESVSWDLDDLERKLIENTKSLSVRKQQIRKNHPYVDANSLSNIHGTHVAGIIASQNKEVIRTHPIKVITESMQTSQQTDRQFSQKYLEQVTKWMDDPLVKRSIILDVEKKLGINGEEFLKEFSVELENLFSASFNNSKLDYYFLDQVLQAIEYAGSEQLKLVNISLGTDYNFPVIDFKNLDVKDFRAPYFDFLRFEFFKWKTAEVIKNKASQTLFFVANGNDGDWKDGHSKSGLPVDISSKFYDSAQSELRRKAPNNDNSIVKNIVGVGSLNQVGMLSSYTNIILGGKNLKLFATGEQIFSPVRVYDFSPLESVRSKYLRGDLGFVMTDAGANAALKEKMSKELIHLKKVDGKIEDSDYDEQLSNLFRGAVDTVNDIISGIKEIDYERYPHIRDRLSGTSMASPMATGVVANLISEHAKKLNVPLSKIYFHPEFTVNKVVSLIEKNLVSVYEGSDQGIDLRKVSREKFVEENKHELAYKNYLKEISAKEGALYKEVLQLSQEKKPLYDIVLHSEAEKLTHNKTSAFSGKVEPSSNADFIKWQKKCENLYRVRTMRSKR